MKTIYQPILAQLKEKCPALKWIDMDKGQLKLTGKDNKPPLIYPCALIGITLPKCKSITDTIQDCNANITVKLAFDPVTYARTSADVIDEIREQHLEPYDIIADVYAALQGFSTDNFDCLNRTTQGEESHSGLFVYKIVFTSTFEDVTAEE